MPGPIIADPTPEWMKAENASVFDPMWKRLARKGAHLIGADDPRSQVVALAAPMEVGPNGGLVGLAQKYLGKAIRAYHGSGADFDQFDFSKIGTGEGAQAYGHGGYFAAAEPVAQGYRRKLSGWLPAGWGDRYPEAARSYIRGVVGDVVNGRDTAERAAKHIYNANSTMRSYPQDRLAAEIAEAAERAKGRMYEVNLKVDPAELLDLDQTLLHQPKVVQQIGARQGWDPSVTGMHIYHELGRPKLNEVGSLREYLGTPDPQVASQRLTEAGVPGARYLDQVSRTQASDIPFLRAQIQHTRAYIKNAGSPLLVEQGQTMLANYEQLLQEALAVEPTLTHNYVMYPGTEGLIDILRKYGILPPLAAVAGGRALDALRQPPQVGTPPPTPPGGH